MKSGINPLPPEKELVYFIVRGRKEQRDGEKEDGKEKDPSHFLVDF